MATTTELSSSSSFDPCRKLVVAIHQSNLRECNDSLSVDNIFLTCDSLEVQVAYFFLRLLLGEYYKNLRQSTRIQCPNSPASYLIKLYTRENRSALFEDLRNDRVDIYPFPVVLNTPIFDYFYVTSPIMISKYHFYVNSEVTESYSNRTPWTFLTSPFSDSVWICTVLALCAGFILLSIVQHAHHRHHLRRRRRSTHSSFHGSRWNDLWSQRIVYALVLVPLASLAAPYCSLLKSFVLQPTTVGPFATLDELVDLIRSSRVRIAIETKYSHRYRLLNEPEFQRPAPLERVHEALRANNDSFHLVDNMSEVCRLMNQYPRTYVYFGYPEILYSACQRTCVWRYDLEEDVDPIMSFVFSKRAANETDLPRLADVLSHAVPNFQRMELDRRYKANCRTRPATKAAFIDARSLYMAFAFLAIGWAISTGLVLCESARTIFPRYVAKSMGRARKARISIDE